MRNLIIVALSLLLFNCTPKEESRVIFEEGTFVLDFGECQIQDNLQVCFLTVEDSRCPKDAICVWEGQAEIDLKVTIDGEESTLSLIARVGEAYADLAVGTVGSYEFTLTDVSPHPESGETVEDEEYIVTIEVIEL